ncbi:uncharacterized protein [Ptychodera flava]|uniref:uncharacterized protein n=1 Tax=Ptychodera flava TaxID=63121 RepID=UPI00396A1B60
MMDYHDGQSAQEDNKVEEGVFYEFKSTGQKKGTKQTMDGYNDNFAGISDQKQEDCMDQTDFEKLHNHKVFSGCKAEYGTEDDPMDGISNFEIDEDMDVTEICNYALKDDSSNSISKYFKEYDLEEHGNCEGDGLGFKQIDT